MDVRREAGRLAAVLVDGGDGPAWIEGWGLPRDEQNLPDQGTVVTVRHLLTPGRREPKIVRVVRH